MWDKFKKKKDVNPIEEIGGFATNDRGVGSGAPKNSKRYDERFDEYKKRSQTQNQYPGDSRNIDQRAKDEFIKQHGKSKIPDFSDEFSYNKLYPFQREIYSLLASEKDIYVVAAPGAGKTRPITTYWFRKFIFGLKKKESMELVTPLFQPDKSAGLFPTVGKQGERFEHFAMMITKLLESPEKIEKLVYAVPVRTLANELYKDFTRYFIDILLYAVEVDSLLNSIPGQKNIILREMQKSVQKHLGSSPNRIQEFVERNLIAMQTGGAKIGNTNLKNTPVIFMTVEKLAHSMSPIKNTGVIIFDEAHLYQPSSNDIETRQHDAVKNAELIIDIFEALNKEARIVMLSGTVGKESANNIIKHMRTIFRRDMQVSAHENVSNPTPIAVIPDDSLNSDSNIERNIIKLVNNHDWGNCFVIYGKNRIDNIVKNCVKKLAPMSQSHKTNDSWTTKKGDVYSRQRSSFGSDIIHHREKEGHQNEERKDIVTRLMKIPGADKIENPELREAVAYGIGVIYTQGEGDRPDKSRMSEEDKMIIADLFSKRKLFILLSTSAIAIGVNVKIRRMFIPSIEMGNTKEPFRNIAQLVNRAGRGASAIGAIYTPQHFVDDVLAGVNANVSDFDRMGKLKTPILAVDVNRPTKKTLKLLLLSLAQPINHGYSNLLKNAAKDLF